jgi:2'-5' RNA ligase
MRLFVALDIDDAIRTRIAGFLDRVRGFAPEARWTRLESLHVTLKFIGERSEDEVVRIEQALKPIEFRPIKLSVRGYGFFPPKHVATVFWAGIDAGADLSSLAATVNERLALLDIPKEELAFSPHLTLARGSRSRSPRKQKSDGLIHGFQRLREKLAATPAPEFGTMAARELFLYQSQTSPGGSKYTKLAAFSLQEGIEHKS